MGANKQRFWKWRHAFFYKSCSADGTRWNIFSVENTVTGKEKYLEFFKMQSLESFSEIKIVNIIADGDYVVVENTGKATTKKGKPYNQPHFDIYRFKDGKIQEVTTYLDTAVSNEAQ